MSTLRTSFLKNEASSSDTIKLNADGSCNLNNPVLDGVVTISGGLNFGTASLPTATDMGGVLLSGSLTSSNPTIVLTSTVNLSGGMLVTGEGIPAGTTLDTIFTNASGTLSSNATATTTFKPVTFYRNDKLLTPASVGGQLCRAWVNFNGTGTVAIRASYNVSSITDNATGDYTVNFATAMPDANYSVVATGDNTNALIVRLSNNEAVPATGSVRLSTINTSFASADILFCNVAVFR
jgi:hypothetical protein